MYDVCLSFNYNSELTFMMAADRRGLKQLACDSYEVTCERAVSRQYVEPSSTYREIPNQRHSMLCHAKYAHSHLSHRGIE